jgi:predicted Zn finger-like uncharacterized protein
MLIVCPNCASSYMIDPAAVGAAGRAVRCARCKASWHVGGPKDEPDVTALVGDVIAETKGEAPSPTRAKAPRPAAATQQAAGDSRPEPAEHGETTAATESQVPPVEPPSSVPAFTEARTIEPEPAVITDAPSLVPAIEHDPLPEAADAALDSEEGDSFDARRLQMQMRRKKPRRSSRWTAVILVLVAFNAALVGARNDVVRSLPQTASLFAAIGLPVNLRGLKFANVRISKEAQDGTSTLTVAGVILSEVGKAVEVPRLRFAARNATGQEVYTWTLPPPRSILGPGERLEFRSQIPAPPAEASDVLVRFVTAQDAVAGAK